jgi:acetyl esterase/lipase
LLFLHGGGFVLGDVEDLAGPGEIAEHAGIVVVSVGYGSPQSTPIRLRWRRMTADRLAALRRAAG